MKPAKTRFHQTKSGLQTVRKSNSEALNHHEIKDQSDYSPKIRLVRDWKVSPISNLNLFATNTICSTRMYLAFWLRDSRWLYLNNCILIRESIFVCGWLYELFCGHCFNEIHHSITLLYSLWYHCQHYKRPCQDFLWLITPEFRFYHFRCFSAHFRLKYIIYFIKFTWTLYENSSPEGYCMRICRMRRNIKNFRVYNKVPIQGDVWWTRSTRIKDLTYFY